MNSTVELDNIINAINTAKKIVIFCHTSPDGDAVGSSLALYLGLQQLKKEVDVICDDFSPCFNFLEGIAEIKKSTNDKYDLAVALDCATKQRLYDPNDVFSNCPVTVVIDHHGTNTFFGKYNYIEAKSPAVCQTLVKILKKLNISITKEIGECLISGIITDSGGFRYANVDSETFEIASLMLNIGVNISEIYYKTFDLKTKSQFALSTLATSRLTFYCQNKVCLTYLTLDDFKKENAVAGDHEGIVNIGRNIEGVEVSIFLRESSKNEWKVSMRSNNKIDVSEIAKQFDGGGHTRAAGCIINLPLEDARKKIIKETRKKL